MLADSEEWIWTIVLLVAVTVGAVGLALPLTLLMGRPKFRVCGVVSLLATAMIWLSLLGIIWADSPGSSHYYYEDAAYSSLAFSTLIGVPAALVSLLMPYAWARGAVKRFLLFAGIGWVICEIGAGLLVAAIMNFRGWNPFTAEGSENLMTTGLVVFGMGTCVAACWVNVGQGDRRHFRWVGIAMAAVATVTILCCLWLGMGGWGGYFEWRRPVTRIAVIATATAIVLAHGNLLLTAPLRAAQGTVRYLSMTAAFVGGAVACLIPFLGQPWRLLAEVLWRMVAGAGIVAGTGAVATIVLMVFNRKSPETPAPGAIVTEGVSLVCPRCHLEQTVRLGESVCGQCDLQFSVGITEPRCPACHYLLFGLVGKVCPECGAAIAKGRKTPMPDALVLGG
jgi:hypothetical protein